MPEVSIIMNCLNCAEFLPQALASLKEQTFQDFEIIFWDNGSIDNSAEIAKAYGSGLHYFQSDATVPLGAARNLAIAKASGAYIAFLDCDDFWLPQKLEKQMALMQANPDAGLVTTDTEVYDGKKTLYHVFAQSRPARGKVFRELIERQWISMSSALVRKKALDATRDPESGPGWFDETLNVCEEADVFYRLAHDYALEYVDEPLTVWRVHGDNTTFKKFGRFAEETLVILARLRRMYLDFDVEYSDVALLLNKRASFQRGIALWREGKGREARACLAPWLGDSNKYKLFWLVSFLPGGMFDFASHIYFMLPKGLRG